MEQYERIPSTPEEIETSRRKKRMLWVMIIPSAIFYALVFIFVPKIPDSPFYLELDKIYGYLPIWLCDAKIFTKVLFFYESSLVFFLCLYYFRIFLVAGTVSFLYES